MAIDCLFDAHIIGSRARTFTTTGHVTRAPRHTKSHRSVQIVLCVMCCLDVVRRAETKKVKVIRNLDCSLLQSFRIDIEYRTFLD